MRQSKRFAALAGIATLLATGAPVAAQAPLRAPGFGTAGPGIREQLSTGSLLPATVPASLSPACDHEVNWGYVGEAAFWGTFAGLIVGAGVGLGVGLAPGWITADEGVDRGVRWGVPIGLALGTTLQLVDELTRCRRQR